MQRRVHMGMNVVDCECHFIVLEQVRLRSSIHVSGPSADPVVPVFPARAVPSFRTPFCFCGPEARPGQASARYPPSQPAARRQRRISLCLCVLSLDVGPRKPPPSTSRHAKRPPKSASSRFLTRGKQRPLFFFSWKGETFVLHFVFRDCLAWAQGNHIGTTTRVNGEAQS